MRAPQSWGYVRAVAREKNDEGTRTRMNLSSYQPTSSVSCISQEYSLHSRAGSDLRGETEIRSLIDVRQWINRCPDQYSDQVLYWA